MSPGTLADLVALFHAAYIAFVVFGFAAILVGAGRGWVWVGNFYFRIAHLGAIMFVCFEVILGTACPLTIYENTLRLEAGQLGPPADFVGSWLDWLIFYNAPQWVFTAVYLAFGALVAATLWFVPVRRPRGRAAGRF
jgi:Protein of Unknown function (DUF2784)